MMNRRCFSLGAVACAISNLVQEYGGTHASALLGSYSFVAHALNSTTTFAGDTTLVLRGSGVGRNDTFSVLDGNHRLLIMLTRALLWESPVCNTDEARVMSRRRYGVVCHNVSLLGTRVKALLVVSPRVKHRTWQQRYGVDPAMSCPRNRVQEIRCLDFRPHAHVVDTDPVFGAAAVLRRWHLRDVPTGADLDARTAGALNASYGVNERPGDVSRG